MDLARTREEERELEKFLGGGGGVISKVLDWKQLRERKSHAGMSGK